MSLDPRTPVVVGVGQVKQQLESDFDQALEPLRLMEEAVRRAGADSGSVGVLSAIDRIGVVGGLWSYPDPGRMLAEAVGSPGAATCKTVFGGNIPQALVTDTAARIAAGQLDVGVCCGGEAVYSRRKLRQAGRDLVKTVQDAPPAPSFGTELAAGSEHEHLLDLDQPIRVYPLFEAALRAATGSTIDEHLAATAELWAGFNAVAVANPYAWVRTPMTADEILDPGNGNRYITWPYTRAMNSNVFVDQAAAVIVTSVGKATELGIPSERWVFPWSATEGHASLLFSERDRYDTNPAVRIAGRRALELARLGVGEIAHFDLYSCFPSMVQITARELDIPPGRALTTTGGLAFFGGPLNNYVMHGIASMVDVLRADPGSHGLVHANGGYATKQAYCVYSTEPPPVPFRSESVQAEVDAEPTRPVDEGYGGRAVVETYCVPHDHGEPARVLLTGLTGAGSRVLGRIDDEAVAADATHEELVGRTVELDGAGAARIV